MLSIAIILDPRSKMLHSNNPLTCSKVLESIKKKIIELRNGSSEKKKRVVQMQGEILMMKKRTIPVIYDQYIKRWCLKNQ